MSESNAGVAEISAVQLWQRLYHQAPAGKWFILDVRNEEEAKGWRVEGPAAVPFVHVSYFSFIDDPDQALAQVPSDLGEAVVVCAKGGSSEFVAGLMRDAGRPALNLTGGMVEWGDFHVPLRISAESEPFELWQFNRFGKGCLSYAVIAGGQAAIVDPSRFPALYEDFAKARGAKIVEVLETHVHADHLSGGSQLAMRNGARYRVLAENGKLPNAGSPVEGGAEIRLGGKEGTRIVAQALRTPGHTPESTSYRVGERYLLSGDTLFVKGVGRPDLGGHVEEWGRALHSTLRHVIAPLPDGLQILPAHFASHEESQASGAVLGTLGSLRATSPELAINDAEEFVQAMKAGVKEPPAIYAEIVRANLGLVDPGEKAGEWELGKNECAATAAKRRAAAAA
ncbi:MAG: MBL fold metallo-hydrolase [Myxococcota bacterium]|nr:MBL fold metallo-hydrolase [Myxococcota bacterium]